MTAQREWYEKDYYAVLGVASDSSAKDITKAYRKLARENHPDAKPGPCKPGFVEDPQGFDQCVKAPDECNDCSCAEYAAANPQECGETPTDTTETGGGASVGGGAGGAFSPFLAGISYTPQPVPEIMQTPQAGMFTQAAPQQPSRNTDILGGSIVAGLLGKYMA